MQEISLEAICLVVQDEKEAGEVLYLKLLEAVVLEDILAFDVEEEKNKRWQEVFPAVPVQDLRVIFRKNKNSFEQESQFWYLGVVGLFFNETVCKVKIFLPLHHLNEKLSVLYDPKIEQFSKIVFVVVCFHGGNNYFEQVAFAEFTFSIFFNCILT